MEKIQASFVLEVLGRPAEHVSEALKNILTAIEKEKGVKVLSNNLHDPRFVEKSKDLFTAFMEVELEVDTVLTYIGLLFAYLPSHVEIIRPEKIVFSNMDLNDLGNLLVQKMHNYDAVTKNTLIERDILLENIKKHAPELIQKLKELYSKKDSKDEPILQPKV
ncbi:MAG: hypothetical protein AABY05_00450 [Nanoarchaeota archaeon]